MGLYIFRYTSTEAVIVEKGHYIRGRVILKDFTVTQKNCRTTLSLTIILSFFSFTESTKKGLRNDLKVPISCFEGIERRYLDGCYFS